MGSVGHQLPQGKAAVEAGLAAFEGLPDDVLGGDEWMRAVFGVTITRFAVEAGATAYADDAVARDAFLASQGGGSREACTSSETAAISEARARILYDTAIAAWQAKPVEFSDYTIFVVTSPYNPNRQDCTELEPLELRASGSRLQPDMVLADAARVAGYFLGTCARKVSVIQPMLEQRQCYDYGAAGHDFFRSWSPEADVTWRGAAPERREAMEAEAEDLVRRLRSTLDTLGWLGAADEPRFEAHTVRR